MSIPCVIHQLWIPPSVEMTELPSKIKSNLERWRSLHADYQYHLWSQEDALIAVRDVNLGITPDEVELLVKQCRFPAMRADLLRVLLLYKFGGYWIDLKMIPKKSFLSLLLGNDLVLTEHHVTTQFPDPAKYGLLNNSFFGCKPGLAYIGEVAIEAFNNVRERKNGVWDVTGPRIYMSVAERHYPRIFEAAYPGLRLLRVKEFWEVLVGWGWSGFNAEGMHWSERMKTEAIYNA